jgi:hypothetical protein
MDHDPTHFSSIKFSDVNTSDSVSSQSSVERIHRPYGTDDHESRRNSKGNDDSISGISNRNNIHIHDNVLSDEECYELIAIHETERHRGYIDHLTITRLADLATMESIHLTLPILRARYICLELVETTFQKELSLFPEFTALMGWQPNSYLKTHYDANRDYLQDRHYSAILYLNNPTHSNNNDNSNNDENNAMEQSHVFDGFVGGDLVFELPNDNDTTQTDTESCLQQAAIPSTSPLESSSVHTNTDGYGDNQTVFRISPKRGRLVCFPSSQDYPHRVDKILSGTRYTLTLWFTENEDAMETVASCRLLEVQSVDTTPLEGALSLVRLEHDVNDCKDKKDGDDNHDVPDDDLANPRTKKKQRLLVQVPSSSSSTSTSTQLQSNTKNCSIVPEQPWETPEQATILLKHTLERANLILDPYTKQYTFSTLSSPPTPLSTTQFSNRIGNIGLDQFSISTLKHILAYVQNKKRKFVLVPEDLVLSNADHDGSIIQEWRQHVHRRLIGLQSASKRWRANGIITNVTDEEMRMTI